MWIERRAASIEGRNRGADFVEQGTGAVFGSPAVDVVPIKRVVTLDGDHVANIVKVLSPFGDGIPAGFRDDDVFRSGDAGGDTVQMFQNDRQTPLEPGQIVGVRTQWEQRNFKSSRLNPKMMSRGACRHLKRSRRGQCECVSQRGRQGLESRRFHRQDDVGILGRSRYSVSHARVTTDQPIGNIQRLQRLNDFAGGFETRHARFPVRWPGRFRVRELVADDSSAAAGCDPHPLRMILETASGFRTSSSRPRLRRVQTPPKSAPQRKEPAPCGPSRGKSHPPDL